MAYEKLPVSDFDWVKESEFHKWDPMSPEFAGDWEAIYEVDLIYPEVLHQPHRDYPLAPSKIAIPFEYLSPFQKDIIVNSNTHYNETHTKLMGHYLPRYNYVVHHRCLKYYIEKGLILKKIHRILKFKQSSWINSFVTFNTQRRSLAKNQLQRDMFKLNDKFCVWTKYDEQETSYWY